MSLKHIAFNRKITSNKKIQYLISNITRSKKLFINKKQVSLKKFLNVGCGPNTNFINLDYSWIPGVDVCWDITKKKYPFEDNVFEGIFTEHCLEHISLDACKKTFQNFTDF